jgi:hypothetical protein
MDFFGSAVASAATGAIPSTPFAATLAGAVGGFTLRAWRFEDLALAGEDFRARAALVYFAGVPIERAFFIIVSVLIADGMRSARLASLVLSWPALAPRRYHRAPAGEETLIRSPRLITSL